MMDTAMQRTQHNGRHAVCEPCASENVGETERWASAVGGGLLALYGLSRLSSGGLLLAACGGALAYRGLTGHCAVYSALGISTAEPRGPATSVPAGRGMKVEKSIHINQPAASLYRFWRNLENLPRFMQHLRSVTTQGNRSHWVARGPLGMSVEWDAEIINDRPDELIAWRSLPGADVDSAGSVHFEAVAGGWGTRVHVTLKYNPPAGKMGAVVAQLFGQNPEAQIEEDLRRFKQLMEAGEVATTYGQPSGRFDWNAR